MKKKLISVMLSASLVVATLTGCGGATANPTTTDKSQTTDAGAGTDVVAGGETAEAIKDINDDGTVNNPENVAIEEGKLVFWSLFSGGDGTFMDEIIKGYNGSGPDMGIQSIMLVWGDYYTKLQTAVAAGKGPDIGVSHVSKLPELIDQGAVIALDDYLQQLEVDMSTTYSSNSLESVSSEGSVYAIPLDTHAEIMYYNKDILEKAGVQLNANGQLDVSSVADFKAILDQIKAVLPEGSTPIALTNQGDDPYRVWWATYFQMGGKALVSDDGTSVTMDEVVAVKAAEFVKSLYDDGYILEGIDDHQKFFQNGKAGIMFGGTWATGAFEQTDGLEFGAQSFPQLFDNDSCWADSHTLIIPFNKNRTEEETLAAVQFVLGVSKDYGATWAKSGQIPSALEVLESKEYLDLEYRSDYKNALQKSVLPTKNANFYAMKAGMIDSLNALWTNQEDAATAIGNLKVELESNLE